MKRKTAAGPDHLSSNRLHQKAIWAAFGPENNKVAELDRVTGKIGGLVVAIDG